jgi:hypothetical protein
VGQVRQGEVDERGVQGRAALAAMYAAARLLQLRCAEGHAVARVLPSGALGFHLLVYFFELLDDRPSELLKESIN